MARVWKVSVALDILSYMTTSYFDIRIFLPWKDSFLNFYLLAVPMFFW